eukprot:TRINITY_DN8062_c0_g1_i1.p1 TRINITY_DN8062_c0_g1~~TRINITY_DN8062_c0_g1_i1.p1  ORF type:complete len:133 (-),score=40.92 TRINITY_DN8062_c0_g1_i1:101-499(-)
MEKFVENYTLVQANRTSKVKFARLNCGGKPGEKFASRFGVDSYPSLRLFLNDDIYEYSGDRTIEDLTRFLDWGYRFAGIVRIVVVFVLVPLGLLVLLCCLGFSSDEVDNTTNKRSVKKDKKQKEEKGEKKDQ